MNILKFKGSQILAHCSSIFEVENKIVAFQVVLPTLQKLFNLVKECERYGVFSERGFIVG
jgi:uncharacterized protein YebE (UPF0316 family)